MSQAGTRDAAVTTLRFWTTIVLAFLASLFVMVACAYLWVFAYSVFIDPTGDQAYYEAYARTASPVVAVVLSFPVFFYVGRCMRRFAGRATTAALAVVAINLTMDVLVVSATGTDDTHLAVMSLLAAAGKLLGAWQGSRP
ncbi:MAG: hypothetical protein AB7I04_05305 [Pseudomonadales bacterium]